MTRNVKRFLALSLLSLTPSIALAGQVELGFPDLPSDSDAYVSLREGGIQVPMGRGSPVASIGPALEDLFVLNQTGLTISLGLDGVTGTFNGVYTPYPVPPGGNGGFQVSAPIPPAVQQFYWTTDPANPFGAKTCRWRVEVSAVGGTCSALVFVAPYGGAMCGIASSLIDPTTCQTQIVTVIR